MQPGLVTSRHQTGGYQIGAGHFDIGKCICLYSEASEVDLSVAEEKVQKLRDTLSSKGYKPDCIFNMDETVLLYKTIPNRTYLLSDEGDPHKARRGSKQMSAKDRMSIQLEAAK